MPLDCLLPLQAGCSFNAILELNGSKVAVIEVFFLSFSEFPVHLSSQSDLYQQKIFLVPDIIFQVLKMLIHQVVLCRDPMLVHQVTLLGHCRHGEGS